jgi:hypothetical protein
MSDERRRRRPIDWQATQKMLIAEWKEISTLVIPCVTSAFGTMRNKILNEHFQGLSSHLVMN